MRDGVVPLVADALDAVQHAIVVADERGVPEATDGRRRVVGAVHPRSEATSCSLIEPRDASCGSHAPMLAATGSRQREEQPSRRVPPIESAECGHVDVTAVDRRRGRHQVDVDHGGLEVDAVEELERRPSQDRVRDEPFDPGEERVAREPIRAKHRRCRPVGAAQRMTRWRRRRGRGGGDVTGLVPVRTATLDEPDHRVGVAEDVVQPDRCGDSPGVSSRGLLDHGSIESS